MEKDKRILAQFTHDIYEHPFDKAALSTLKNIPGFDYVANFITTNTVERVYKIQYTGSHLRITHDNYPQIYDYLEYACKILNMTKAPELYVEWDYSINSFTVGAENPIIVLNSGLIDLCDDDEIMFLIGRELGHIKSNHMLYQMMAQVFNVVVGMIPAGINIAAAPLQAALLYWVRMSEFSADRAGLLCCQNKDAAIKTITKMTGVPIKCLEGASNDIITRQAEQFKAEYGGIADRAIRALSVATSTNPWTVYRAGELQNWMDSKTYDSILDGYEKIPCNKCNTGWATRKHPTCHFCGMKNDFDSLHQ